MDIVLRFFVGGLVVSLFAVLGQSFEPKTFAGLFGAAPSVALASLGLAYERHGSDFVAREGRSMIIGAIAFAAYGATYLFLTKREHEPVLLSAVLSWGSWLAVAALGVLALHLAGAT